MKKYTENKERLEKLYEDPNGLWEVSEQAEYGRGSYHIGYYFGHFADIALHVKDVENTSRPLVFTKMDTEQMMVPTDTTGEVVVIMGHNSPFAQNEISSADTCKEYEESCKAKDVTLRDIGGGPASMLVKRESEQSKLRASAMAKILTALSPEELAAMFPEEAKKIAAAVATTESEE